MGCFWSHYICHDGWKEIGLVGSGEPLTRIENHNDADAILPRQRQIYCLQKRYPYQGNVDRR